MEQQPPHESEISDVPSELRRLFTTAAGAAVLAAVSFLVITALLSPQSPTTYALGAIYGVCAGLALFGIRSGRFNLGATLFVVLNWLVAAAFLFLEGPNTSHIGIFFVTIILASALARPMTSALVGVGAAVLLALITGLAESGAYTPANAVGPEAPTWAAQIAQLVTAGVVASLIARGTLRLIARLRRQADDSARSNIELAQQRQELAERVRDQEEAAKREAVLQESMRKAQKLEAIGRLAGSIAHDFNNLLTVVLSAAELAGHTSQEQTRELLGEITTAGQSAARLTAQLVALGGQRGGPVQVVDIGESVERLAQMVGRLTRDQVELRIDAEPGCRSRMNPSHLDQVVMNLSVNALDAMPDGGELRLSVSRDDDTVILRVADNGHGMDDEERSRIFEPLYTTKADGRGSGIGLAVVQQVVKASGGTIEVESARGEGTCFTVCLPATTARRQAEPGSRAGPVASGVRILLVDDDEAVRRAAERTLKGGGYQVISCDGLDSVRAVMRDRPELDVIVCDVVLKGCSGPEVVEFVHSVNPDILVIYISGYTAGMLRRHGVPTSVPVVNKPFGQQQLISAVGTLIDNKNSAEA